MDEIYSKKGKSKKRRAKAIGEISVKEGEGGGCCAGPN